MHRVDPSIQYGVIDFAHLETQPGGCGPLAPPAGWQGDEAQYVEFLRGRYRDMGGRQHLFLAARSLSARWQGRQAILSGPYCEVARKILKSISE